MFDNFFISREEINKVKISSKKPFGLTTEKITKLPRSFNTSQIREAVKNINLIEDKEGLTPKLLLKAIEFLLGEFFLYMHQSGLYNRQLTLWKTLGNITQCNVYMFKKGLIKKQSLDYFTIDFFIDPKAPCISAILLKSNIDKKEEVATKLLEGNLLRNISIRNMKRLKGVFYLLNTKPGSLFFNKLDILTNAIDPVAKYESLLSWTKDVRLNVVSFNETNEDYYFEHVYPQVKANRESLIKK